MERTDSERTDKERPFTLDAPPSRVRWLILCLLIGFTFLGHFNRVSISVAGNERFIGPDKLSEQQMGLVYSAFLLAYSISMLPGGWVIDHIGPRWALTGMGLGMGSFVALTGGLGWLGWPIGSLLLPLLVVRGLAGVFSAPLHPGTARAVSLWMPLTGRLTANGLVTAGALTGIAFTAPVFGHLIDLCEWPLAFVISGSLLAVFSLVWNRVSADDPASHPATNAAERALIGHDPTQVRHTATARDLLEMLANRDLVLLGISYAALGYFQYLFFYWIGFYFNDTLHLPKEQSRDATFTVTIAMAVGMALGGWISERVCRRLGFRQGCRLMAVCGMCLSAVFAWIGVSTTSPQAVVAYFSLALASLGTCEGVFWTTASTLERRRGGLAAAFINTASNLGGMIAPALTPWIGKTYSWTTAIIVACVICGLGGLLWLLINSDGQDRVTADSSHPRG